MSGERNITRAIFYNTLPAFWLLQVACSFGLIQPDSALALAIPASPLVHISVPAKMPAKVPAVAPPGVRLHDCQRQAEPGVRQAEDNDTRTVSKLTKWAKKIRRVAVSQALQQIVPGLVYRSNRGAKLVNILDVDLQARNIHMQPLLAGDCFNTLDVVNHQARKANAVAAINANYFKKDGVPLGTLVLNGELLAGPIYQRAALGITADGHVLIDRVSLQGVMETSRADLAAMPVDNINQPRINGSALVVYTRRWGSLVRMPYPGILAAVDKDGYVIAKAETALDIPKGGFVLSDKKGSKIDHLQIGDAIHIDWHVTPGAWGDVVQAVSGGPVLLRNGKIEVDCQAERFPRSWSGNGIKARTVVGVTRDRHLIMATIEGNHSLYDAARMLQTLGVCDALNLDGGGSTTMVVAGRTVTRNQRGPQRCVAASLAVVSYSDTAAGDKKVNSIALTAELGLRKDAFHLRVAATGKGQVGGGAEYLQSSAAKGITIRSAWEREHLSCPEAGGIFAVTGVASYVVVYPNAAKGQTQSGEAGELAAKLHKKALSIALLPHTVVSQANALVCLGIDPGLFSMGIGLENKKESVIPTGWEPASLICSGEEGQVHQNGGSKKKGKKAKN